MAPAQKQKVVIYAIVSQARHAFYQQQVADRKPFSEPIIQYIFAKQEISRQNQMSERAYPNNKPDMS